MRKFLFVAFFFVSVTILKSQQLYFEAGKTISSFNYSNSQGTSLENLRATDHTFMTLGYRKNVFTKNLFLNADGSYNSYGAIGSDRDLNNYFEWNLNYLGAQVGLDYEIYKPGNFRFYLKGLISTEFLIQGTQTINNQVHKLSGDEDFKAPMFFMRGGLGVQYKVSDKLAVFTQYLYGKGFPFKDIQGNLKINAHNFGFGLLINLSKSKQQPTTEVEFDNAQNEQLQKALDENTQKIKELETKVSKVDTLEEEILAIEEKIMSKEKEILLFKRAIARALSPYDSIGLTVEEREGLVYVTLESDMLFQPGSWEIGSDGEKAVIALGKVLAANLDVTVLIEGHTDNDPFKPVGNIKNNWDLSAKRATTIVEILRSNNKINPKNLTAAGRGEYAPIADNTTAEGRAKNRRIEVILTPKIDEVLKLIKK